MSKTVVSTIQKGRVVLIDSRANLIEKFILIIPVGKTLIVQMTKSIQISKRLALLYKFLKNRRKRFCHLTRKSKRNKNLKLDLSFNKLKVLIILLELKLNKLRKCSLIGKIVTS
jgi:hypothetical protein